MQASQPPTGQTDHAADHPAPLGIYHPADGDAEHDPARDLDTVRGALIARLDRILMADIDAVCGECRLTRDMGIKLIQRVQLALFPSEFGEDPVAAADIRATQARATANAGRSADLVPAGGGLRAVSPAQLAAFARLLKSGGGFEAP